MSRVSYQSEFKSVAIVRNNDARQSELHLSIRREPMAGWWKHRKPEHTSDLNDASALIQIASPIAPIFHGSQGNYLEIEQAHTGAF